MEQQAGTKQKPFEDEIELVWEKGGSGLNFYTDVQVNFCGLRCTFRFNAGSRISEISVSDKCLL